MKWGRKRKCPHPILKPMLWLGVRTTEVRSQMICLRCGEDVVFEIGNHTEGTRQEAQKIKLEARGYVKDDEGLWVRKELLDAQGGKK